MLDLKIKNGKAFIPGAGFFEVGIGVKDGKIVVLGDAEVTPEASATLDAAGKIVMPGIIDPHIHLGIFNDFAFECEHETRAALAGGITTVGVFMGGGDSYLTQLGSLIDIVEQKSSVDLFFHLSIFTDEQMGEMQNYFEKFGVTSFKFYMAGVKGVFPGVSDGFIYEGFKRIAAMGDRATACIHCEDQSMLDIAFEKVSRETPNGSLADWAKTGPNVAEEEAVMRACFLAEQAGNRLYIVHISSKQGSDRFAFMRRNSCARLFGETTSAYLSVSKEDPIGLLAKMLPPIKGEEDIDALWEHVRLNELDSFGTDNVSMNREVKGAEKGMLDAMPGYPILQTHLPAILTQGYHKRGVDIETILTKVTVNPAKIFGLYPQKGTIAVGSDADLVILDLDREETVKSQDLFSYGDFSLYDGKALKGWPSAVVKAGQVAFKDGEITVKPGIGRYLRRQL